MISLYDSLHLGIQKKFQRLVFFICGNLVFRFDTDVEKGVPKQYTGVFLYDISGNNGFSLENSGGQPQFSPEALR